MLNILKTHFGFDQFRPLQEEIIGCVMAQKDAFVLMPTGAGKSLCFQLPALKMPGVTLVISPLIALMKDQVDALKADGIPAEFINSTLTRAEIDRIQTQALRGEIKILYAAPERLTIPEFQLFLQKIVVSLIAIDESHCISEWGHDFRPDYRNLKMLRNMFPAVPVMALTATATQKVREDIISQLSLEKAKIFTSSFNRPNLSYAVLPKKNSYDHLINIFREHRDEAAIIYCFSRKDTEHLAADLRQEGFKALPYHAGLESDERRTNQEKFIRDEAQIIVATIAFGMGIDKPDVRLVIHYHLPKSIEGYYQETGRAGRDGLPSRCILFYSAADAIKQQYFIRQIEDEGERKNAYRKLDQMVEYSELATCRRSHLLAYFGENYNQERCDGCDICFSPQEDFDATIVSQKIMSAIIRTGQRFGINYIIDVLVGAKNKKILERDHHELSVYGIVDDFSKEDLRRIVSQLVLKNLIVKNGDEYPILELSPRGQDFLKQREEIRLPKPKSVAKLSQPSDAVETEYARDLFEQLRRLRKELADEQGIPPFVVFGDLALRQMAVYLPQSEENFSRISGVGQEKLKRYGKIFTEVIQTYAQENNLSEKDVPVKRSARPRRSNRLGSTYRETKELVLQKMSIEEMASMRGLAAGTIAAHIEKLLSTGEKIDIDYLRPPVEQFETIKAAFKKSGGTALFPVREMLGEPFSYEELRIARLFIKS
ncbi:MAG: DNA helicase RecQ [Proteobacteria bacterium]|nr:DNA helicase RecQ [Pseudomonadota bacterium]MBU4354910.1 DNA helicase RecQ [Pseudomonadota bacterium]MBU4448335.1 DNA helicase RecQ [Pseudomonadota bacterium]MCG2772652.1 DNA helicase RecQ [Desulfobacterales bacterium]